MSLQIQMFPSLKENPTKLAIILGRLSPIEPLYDRMVVLSL